MHNSVTSVIKAFFVTEPREKTQEELHKLKQHSNYRLIFIFFS